MSCYFMVVVFRLCGIGLPPKEFELEHEQLVPSLFPRVAAICGVCMRKWCAHNEKAVLLPLVTVRRQRSYTPGLMLSNRHLDFH